MLGRSRRFSTVVSGVVDRVSPYADELAHDPEFRRRLAAAAGAGIAAKRRARRLVSVAGLATRLGSDPVLRAQVTEAMRQLQRAQKRAQHKQRHTARNVAIVLAGTTVVAAAAVPEVRRAVAKAFRGLAESRRGAGVEQEIEVDVPVATAYSKWTQFEDFPSFMEGVDEVKQLDDTLLHWAATVAGRKAEWDARIVERDPERRIAWESVDGKHTRGAVTFEPLGPARTRIRLELAYEAEGPAEQAGSAIGLDSRRVRGDLERFRQLVESRAAGSVR